MIVDLFAGGGMTEQDRQDAITRAQRRGGRLPTVPRTAEEYLRVARWWRLEAKRGRSGATKALEYAGHMKWASEIALIHGPGRWQELREIAARLPGASPGLDELVDLFPGTGIVGRVWASLSADADASLSADADASLGADGGVSLSPRGDADASLGEDDAP